MVPREVWAQPSPSSRQEGFARDHSHTLTAAFPHFPNGLDGPLCPARVGCGLSPKLVTHSAVSKLAMTRPVPR